MHEWFAYLFEQRMDRQHNIYCFECGDRMPESLYKELSTCYSHLLGKKQYPKYAGNAANVVIVCPDCHHLYTMKPKQAVKQYAKYKQLLKEYEDKYSKA
jgi:DNA-directed RNA polymerase subunit RPC12/RpoP